MKSVRTPIALFAFNRPQHVTLALETLTRCARFDECDLHVYCDGPKRPEQAEAVQATRRAVRTWATCYGARVIERDHNLGLAHSIVNGVTELCQQYGRAIVVEDDLALRPDFLDYMLQALDRYADCPNVYQISGYMFPVEHPPQPDAFFLPLTTTWGWATWERAWRIFDWNATGALAKLADPELRRRFDLNDSYPYTRMLERRLAGQNDSWGILWWWCVFNANGVGLHPRRSLVWVGGRDGTGTHSGRDPDVKNVSLEEMSHPAFGGGIRFPEIVAASRAQFAIVCECLRKQQSVASSLRFRVARRFRRIVPMLLH